MSNYLVKNINNNNYSTAVHSVYTVHVKWCFSIYEEAVDLNGSNFRSIVVEFIQVSLHITQE